MIRRKSLSELSPPDNKLNDITKEYHEVEYVLNSLNISIASVPDLISPRLLKEASSVLKSHDVAYLTFLSRLVSFPLCWKRAKEAI